MSIEITMLAAAGGLALALTLIQGTRNVIVLGLPTAWFIGVIGILMVASPLI